MTTCVYCNKDIDEYGNYKEYNCPKLRDADDCLSICEKCSHYIDEGQEVPAP